MAHNQNLLLLLAAVVLITVNMGAGGRGAAALPGVLEGVMMVGPGAKGLRREVCWW